MRILHFVHDQFFMPPLIALFRRFGTDSRFVCLYTTEPTYKHINAEMSVEFIKEGSDAYEKLLKEKDFDVVWIHPAMPERARFVNRLNDPRIVVVWSSWGADLYGWLCNRLLGWRTFLVWSRSVSFGKAFRAILKRILVFLGLRKLIWNAEDRKFLKRVDFFSMILDNEGELARKIVPSASKQVYFYYPPPNDPNGSDSIVYPCVDLHKRNLWMGNSANIINNYFDMIPMAATIGDFEVFSALAYGLQGKMIDEAARRRFGDRWHPYFDFVPLKEYVKRMAQCSVFVFGLYRQGATLNVEIALRCGGCVFLSVRNPHYAYLKGHGIEVYTLEDLKCRFDETLANFAPLQRANMAKANELFSADPNDAAMRETLKTIEAKVQRRKQMKESSK